jgi:hypothetical protein
VPGEAGDHDIGERPDHRRVGQLASRGQQLLGDERQPARPIGHEDESGRGRPFALNRLDELGELRSLERRDRDPGRPAIRRRRHLGEGPRQRVVAGELVGLPGADQTDPLGTMDPAHERDEGTAAGVCVMEIFDDKEDRSDLGDPSDDAE